MFSETAEFLGLEIRPKLAALIFTNNDNNFILIKKLIKVVMYINRLI